MAKNLPPVKTKSKSTISFPSNRPTLTASGEGGEKHSPLLKKEAVGVGSSASNGSTKAGDDFFEEF